MDNLQFLFYVTIFYRCSSVTEVYNEVSKAILGSEAAVGAVGAWRLATICLSGVCVALVLLTIALAIRTHTLSKRPKLWRRYLTYFSIFVAVISLSRWIGYLRPFHYFSGLWSRLFFF